MNSNLLAKLAQLINYLKANTFTITVTRLFNKYNFFTILFVLTIVWLLIIQVAFYYVQLNQAKNSTLFIHGQLRQELDFSNFQFINRNLSDLDNKGTIKCTKLLITHPKKTVILDLTYKGNCNQSDWFLNGASQNVSLQALNGDQFTVQFQTVNNLGFILSLWAVRIAGLLQIFSFYWIQKFKKEKQTILQLSQKKHEQELVNLAAHIAHDIRSPLTTLNFLMDELSGLPDDRKNLVKHSIKRINDIASDLLTKNKALNNTKLGANAQIHLNAKNDSSNSSNSSNSQKSINSLGSKNPMELLDFDNLNKSQSACSLKTINSNSVPFCHSTLIFESLYHLLLEKNVESRIYKNIMIQGDFDKTYGLFCNINKSDLNRVLSNLINNSIEAIQKVSHFNKQGDTSSDQHLSKSALGKISISARKNKDNIQISISDNGCGIPDHILQKLGQLGVSDKNINQPMSATRNIVSSAVNSTMSNVNSSTISNPISNANSASHSVNSGSGLGIYHAIKTIENAGGSFDISSQINVGTFITITLPLAKTPEWFAQNISVNQDNSILVIDDDESIFSYWSNIFVKKIIQSTRNKIEPKIKLSYLNSSAKALKENLSADLYLVDFDFINEKFNGLDIINKLNIASKTILVTNRFDDPKVQKEALAKGFRLLPKFQMPYIPIYYTE